MANRKIGILSTSDVRVLLVFTTEDIGEVFNETMQRQIPDITSSLLKKVEGAETISVECNHDSVFLLLKIQNTVSVADLARTIKTHLGKQIRNQFPDELAEAIGKNKVFMRGYISLTGNDEARSIAEKIIDSYNKPSEYSLLLSEIHTNRHKKGDH